MTPSPSPPRLATFRLPGDAGGIERTGVLDPTGEGLTEVGGTVVGWLEDVQADARALDRLAIAARTAAIAVDDVEVLPPVTRPGKIVMAGANYAAHVDEGAAGGYRDAPKERPRWPTAFIRFTTCLSGHRATVAHPAFGSQLDYEAELAVVIGRRCKDVTPDEALAVVGGYTIINDLSLRDVQFWEKANTHLLFGKNADGTAPCGPGVLPAACVPDPQALELTCSVNGEVRQHASTADMIWSVAEIVAHCSMVTLEPGDLISTGSPEGVGIFRDPPEDYLLRPGDRVDVDLSGVGRLTTFIGP